MNTVYLLLGSNQGDRADSINKACLSIEKNIGKIVNQSLLYESEAWGFVSDNFINQVLCVETELMPTQILELIFRIETDAGRKRINNDIYETRPLDIDILFYNNLIVCTKALTIPHPCLHKRLFTLMPLAEIAADFIHPVLKVTIQQLLDENQDSLKVWIYAM